MTALGPKQPVVGVTRMTGMQRLPTFACCRQSASLGYERTLVTRARELVGVGRDYRRGISAEE